MVGIIRRAAAVGLILFATPVTFKQEASNSHAGPTSGAMVSGCRLD